MGVELDKLSNLTRKEIVDRAEGGDTTMLPAVREMIRELPDAVAVLGDTAQSIREHLIEKVTPKGTGVIGREAKREFVEEMIADLAGPDPSRLESLLAEQVATCWLHLQWLESAFAWREEFPISWGKYMQRSIGQAQRRYLQAIRTLAQIRKLGPSVLQVNIAADGGKQVNKA